MDYWKDHKKTAYKLQMYTIQNQVQYSYYNIERITEKVHIIQKCILYTTLYGTSMKGSQKDCKLFLKMHMIHSQLW
jgi:hypothetical protein